MGADFTLITNRAMEERLLSDKEGHERLEHIIDNGLIGKETEQVCQDWHDRIVSSKFAVPFKTMENIDDKGISALLPQVKSGVDALLCIEQQPTTHLVDKIPKYKTYGEYRAGGYYSLGYGVLCVGVLLSDLLLPDIVNMNPISAAAWSLSGFISFNTAKAKLAPKSELKMSGLYNGGAIHVFNSTDMESINTIAHEYGHFLIDKHLMKEVYVEGDFKEQMSDRFERMIPRYRVFNEGFAEGLSRQYCRRYDEDKTAMSSIFCLPRLERHLKEAYAWLAVKNGQCVPESMLAFVEKQVNDAKKKKGISVYSAGDTLFYLSEQRNGPEIYRKALTGDFSIFL